MNKSKTLNIKILREEYKLTVFEERVLRKLEKTAQQGAS
jgi:hypothetical protein